MKRDYCTMDDFSFNGKTVLLRSEFNSPIGKDGKITDDKRIRESVPTIEALKAAKVAILAHQGRPGKKDFTTLEQHAQHLQKHLNRDVRYVDSIFSSEARKAIEDMRPGDVILLENVRFYSEEQLERPPEEQAKTIMVRKLAPLFDVFLNDAFGASHRSHDSMVGFDPVLPSGAGKLMAKEIDALTKATTGGAAVYVLGGAKVDDSVEVTKSVLEKGIASQVLVTGAVANAFLAASGVDIGKPSMEYLENNKYLGEIETAEGILNKFDGRVVLPVDVAINKDGKREDIGVKGLPTSYVISDIGRETIAKFSDLIGHADKVVINGPAGIFENPQFRAGTDAILRAATEAKFSVIGGGHSTEAVDQLGIADRISHVSTGGGAAIDFLAGKPMPAIEALKAACARMRKMEKTA